MMADPTENSVPPAASSTAQTRDPILAGRKIVFVVGEDWYFCSHRLPIGKALRAAGAEVVVATRVRDHRAVIERAGLRVVAIGLDRSGLNPLRDLGTVVELVRLYRRERPDLVHHVALKPTLYGGIAAWLAGVPAVVHALAGLGYLFTSRSPKARLLRPVVRFGFRALVNRRNSRTILQNPDDMAYFERECAARPPRLALIRGAGVDIGRFAPTAAPDGIPVAACVSRMLWQKGVGELVQAARLLRDREVPIRIRLIGPTDENPGSVPQPTLDEWRDEGIVEVIGPSDDIAGDYARAHIAVLPSYYGEGLPKSLLEAAACARPIVAADVPGSREICRDGETGILVPARRVEPLADALERLARDPELRQRLGDRARAVAVTEFAEDVVVAATLDLYRTLLAETAP